MTTKEVQIEFSTGEYLTLIIEGDIWYNSNHQLVMHEKNQLETPIYLVDGSTLLKLKNDDTSFKEILSEKVKSVSFVN